MKKSKLNLDVVLEEAIGGEHRIYRHACSDKPFYALSKTIGKDDYCVAETDEELTLLECNDPKPWTFYNYFHIASFLYTPAGVVVAGVVSLKEKAEYIEVSIEVLDKRTREVLVTKKLEVASKYSFRFEEVFSASGKEAEELLTTVTATWRQNGRIEVLTAVRERCIGKSFIPVGKSGPVTCDTGNYTHIYPKKENSPVIFGMPEIHPLQPDYKQYDSQKDIVVALLRLPEKRTDCDYICGFERGPDGHPYLSVPAKGKIDLREKGGAFVGVISRHCILTRRDEAGGATLLNSNETKNFENPDLACTFNEAMDVLTYDGTDSWRQEFDYPAGWDKTYRFDYDLTIDYEYKVQGISALDRLHVSSGYLFCDCHIPAIRIMYGCLAKDTLILLADGSRKRIDEIRIGDFVISGLGANKIRRVTNIWRGMEEELICIRARERTLSLTESHPVATPQGVAMAGDMKKGMEVLLEGGDIEMITDVGVISYNDVVYNLELEDEREPYVVAGGFIVGDMFLQNRP